MAVMLRIKHIIGFWLLLLCAMPALGNKINSVRVWPAPENTRIVLDLTQQPSYSYFSLKSPQRLVIDLKNTQIATKLANIVSADKRVLKIRRSKAKAKKATRLVLELAQAYTTTVFALKPAGQYGHRLVIDLYDRKKTAKIVAKSSNKQRDIVIAIDAGHGGEDPGSIGAKGSYEKHVTLAVAKKLKRLINQQKGMKAVLTRKGDYFVDLNKRTDLARRYHADFLVSIHADAFRTSQPSGSSVWVISDRRVESELARWLVNREKNSELLGGGGGVIKHTQDDNLAFMLADMNKDHSLEVSIDTAEKVIRQLKKINKLHKRVPQHASFAVLKASDIPSILVETGFISNYREEKNLNAQAHQMKLAHAIFKGIKHHFISYPPKDTYFASISYKKHRVSRGESLSVLAQRYNVPVGKIKSLNNLSSNTVRIGQTLKIPRAE